MNNKIKSILFQNTKIFIVMELVTLIFYSQSLWAQEDQRYKDVSKVQKVLDALSTTNVVKMSSIKALLLEAYKEDVSAIEAIKETPEEELTEVMGLKKMVVTGYDQSGEAITEMVDDMDAIKNNVLDIYFRRYEQTVGTGIPYEPIPLNEFVALLRKSSTLRELIVGTMYPKKIWIAEFQWGNVILNVVENPLNNLTLLLKKETSSRVSESVHKELKEAFILFIQDFLREDVEKFMNHLADQVYSLRAGPLARWIKKNEIKSHLIQEFKEEPYSVFKIEDYFHTDLLFVATLKDLPKAPDPRKPWPKDTPWWRSMSADWSVFQESDYFVAAPSMIGMIGDESLGPGDVQCYVFRKVEGKWKIVGM